MTQPNRWAPKKAFTSGGVIPTNPSPWVEVTYLTDPDRIAALLPPPLQPGDRPEVYVRIINVSYPEFDYQEMVGYFAVSCKYQGRAGEYPLLIPIDLESAVYISRETFGQPKVVAHLTLSRQGNRVDATIKRNGVTFLEINGEVTGKLPTPAPYEAPQWWFKCLPAVDGNGFDAGPLLVQSDDLIETVSLEKMQGTLTLRDSATDPVADLPVRELVSMNYRSLRAVSKRSLIGPVDAEAFAPFLHIRYFGVGGA